MDNNCLYNQPLQPNENDRLKFEIAKLKRQIQEMVAKHAAKHRPAYDEQQQVNMRQQDEITKLKSELVVANGRGDAYFTLAEKQEAKIVELKSERAELQEIVNDYIETVRELLEKDDG